jgi:hypothetical protein
VGFGKIDAVNWIFGGWYGKRLCTGTWDDGCLEGRLVVHLGDKELDVLTPLLFSPTLAGRQFDA